MRILHVANFSWFHNKRKRADNMARYYAPDRRVSNGLTRNGHNVWDFSYRDTARHLAPLGLGKKLGAQKMNDFLIEHARHYQPHLLLLGHCELITPETLTAIRDMLPDCKIAQWWVDSFNDYAISHLSKKLPLLDAFYATTAPEYYRPLLATASAGAKLPPLYYLPNIVDFSTETGTSFANTNHTYDLLFIGADAPERAPLLQKLQQLPNVRCGFFGFGGRRKITGAEYVATLNNSKIGLNLSRMTNIPLYSSDRLAQLTGNGCLAITPRTPQMDILFSEQEVIYYDSTEALPDLIRHYSDDNSDWRHIAEAGYTRAHTSYNERRVAQFMLEATMGEKFSQPYEWLAVTQ